MSTSATAKRPALPEEAKRLSSKYGCGPVQFSGTDEALYERHLLFDSGVDLADATCTRSVRGPCAVGARRSFAEMASH